MAEVYLLASTKLENGFTDYLEDIEQTKWVEPENAYPDLLCEMAGRLCYKSWAPGVNPNVTKVRPGNKKYLKNILESGHGSVLEHVNFTFLLRGVSRVLTHELVRHRVGCAYSQESLRYCMLDHLEVIIPQTVDDDVRELMENAVSGIRCAIIKLNKLLLSGTPDFRTKKEMTSLIRRIAPIGISTNIIFTANARALRHIIQQRTSDQAEVEIRQVFKKVADICTHIAPHIFQDLTEFDGFKNPKV